MTYKNFELAGANLSDADKAKLKALNREAATLSTQFTNKLLAASKNGALAITDPAKLDGLSEGELAAAARAAAERKLEKQWLLVLQNTTQQPLLQSLKDRDTRQALFDASRRVRRRATATIPVRPFPVWPRCAPNRPSCWATRTTPHGNCKTRWPRRRMPR